MPFYFLFLLKITSLGTSLGKALNYTVTTNNFFFNDALFNASLTFT